MATCNGCGGVVGRDCFNPSECEWIAQDMERQEVMRQAESVARDAVNKQSGISLRDYFAAKAMQSMLLDTKQFAGCGLGEAPLAAVPDIIAGWSYLMADAMLKARETSND